MTTIAKGNETQFYVAVDQTLTFTPGSGGTLDFGCSTSGSTADPAPRKLYEAAAIAIPAGSTVFLRAEIADGSYTTVDNTGGGGGSGAWGGITGTLSDQTDLQSALDAKAAYYVPAVEAANFTLAAASHANRRIDCTKASAQTVTWDTGHGMAEGDCFRIVQCGAGAVTLAAGTGTLSLSAGLASATTYAVGDWIDCEYMGDNEGGTNVLRVTGTSVAGVLRITSKSADYTLTLADAGSDILHPAADTTARTWTIPANAAVAYPVGTVISFTNQNAGGVITIAITSDTMRLGGAGTTGSRTLAANGVATAKKITSTEWIISGVGLT